MLTSKDSARNGEKAGTKLTPKTKLRNKGEGQSVSLAPASAEALTNVTARVEFSPPRTFIRPMAIVPSQSHSRPLHIDFSPPRSETRGLFGPKR